MDDRHGEASGWQGEAAVRARHVVCRAVRMVGREGRMANKVRRSDAANLVRQTADCC